MAESTYYGAIPGQAFCEYIALQEDNAIKLLGSEEVNHEVDMLILENANGPLDTATFTLLPKIHILTITSSTIDSIVPGSFEAIPKLDVLSLVKNVSLPPLTKDVLASSTLTTLNVEANTDLVLEPNCFSHLGNLKNLSIRHQAIPHLTKDLFEGLTTLQELTIESCGVKEIDPDCFEGLENLDYLNMDCNEIERFEPEVFSHLGGLIWLVLLENPNVVLEKEHMEHLVSLEELGVPFEKLLELQKNGVLECLPKLKKVHVRLCDCEREEYEPLVQELAAKNVEIDLVLGSEDIRGPPPDTP